MGKCVTSISCPVFINHEEGKVGPIIHLICKMFPIRALMFFFGCFILQRSLALYLWHFNYYSHQAVYERKLWVSWMSSTLLTLVLEKPLTEQILQISLVQIEKVQHCQSNWEMKFTIILVLAIQLIVQNSCSQYNTIRVNPFTQMSETLKTHR